MTLTSDYLGIWASSPVGQGLTQIHVASLNLSAPSGHVILSSYVYSQLPNQQNGQECDFYQSAILWDVVATFCSGYTTPVQYSTSAVVPNFFFFCSPFYQRINSSSGPPGNQLLYSKQTQDLLQLIRIQNGAKFDGPPLYSLPVFAYNMLEVEQYQAQQLTQGYTNLICPLHYTQKFGLAYRGYSTSDYTPWDAVGITCQINSNYGSADQLSELQLIDGGNTYNLTISGPITTSDGAPGISLDLPKNYQFLSETIFQGHMLQLSATQLLCAKRGRTVQLCSDCLL